jgi:hypothetical protein
MCIIAALPVPDSILRTLPFASSRARARFPWGTSLGDGGTGAGDREMRGRRFIDN